MAEINRRLYLYYHTLNKAHVYRIEDLEEQMLEIVVNEETRGGAGHDA